ncbi:MAG TPA: ATP-dependent DNA helicase [Candidatus Acidoferrum sp.]|nr:ATP-dependent DNA helicase [Candidatus Acidoferrum sp.]
MRRSQRGVDEEADSELAATLGPRGLLREVLPDFEYRPAQLQMAQAVEQVITRAGILLAEAGTGTGKTLAYLIPAILSGQKTLVATGTKTLQDQLFFKDIPLLAAALPRRFTASLMKGRGNYLCRRNLRRALEAADTRAQHLTLLKIQKWSATSVRGDRAEVAFLREPDPLWDNIAAWSDTCLGTACEDYQECFLTRMRQEAGAADVVIANHHLLLADAVLRDRAPLRVMPSYDVLVVDEAHLLEDVATDFFGVEISNLRIERLIRDTLREWSGAGAGTAGDRSLPDHLSHLAQASARFFRSLGILEGSRRLRPDALEGICREACHDLIAGLILLRDLASAGAEKPEGLLACARRAEEQAAILTAFLDGSKELPDAGAGQPMVRWAEQRGRGIFLRASPLDVSADLRRTVLDSAQAVILTSATLSAGGRFDFLRSRLGIQEAREFQAASPFDYAHQAILYVPRHLPDPRSPGFIDAAAQEISNLLEITQGRALVLFTSLDAMETTYRLVDGRIRFPLMVQGQAPRTELLERFRQDVASVLFATRSFWQGVDVAGEALSCVIIHKLPFGFPGDPILEARLEHIQQQGDDPFWGYQIPSAIITLRQGLGRLIRSEQDRGALCILDNRLLSRGYGRAFLQSLPPCPVTSEFAMLRQFFRSETGSEIRESFRVSPEDDPTT